MENELSQYDKKYDGMATVDIIRAMDSIRALKDDVEAQLTELNKEYDHIRLNLIPRKFEEEGIDNIRVDGIGRVSLTSDLYVRINSADRDRVHEYFRDIGKSSLITESINSSTLKAAIKAMIKSGEEIPEDIIKITPFTRASITKR